MERIKILDLGLLLEDSRDTIDLVMFKVIGGGCWWCPSPVCESSIRKLVFTENIKWNNEFCVKEASHF